MPGPSLAVRAVGELGSGRLLPRGRAGAVAGGRGCRGGASPAPPPPHTWAPARAHRSSPSVGGPAAGGAFPGLPPCAAPPTRARGAAGAALEPGRSKFYVITKRIHQTTYLPKRRHTDSQIPCPVRPGILGAGGRRPARPRAGAATAGESVSTLGCSGGGYPFTLPLPP